MAEISISHRRDDSQYRARLIYDALTKAKLGLLATLRNSAIRFRKGEKALRSGGRLEVP